MITVSVAASLRAAEIMAGAGLALSTCEWLWLHRGNGGSRILLANGPGILSRLLVGGVGLIGVPALLAIRLALVAALGLSPSFSVLFALFAIQVVLKNVLPGGLDGSDDISAPILLGAALARGWPSPHAGEIGLGLIAGQGIIAYATAGVAKVLGPRWRNGSALKIILATRNHGIGRQIPLAVSAPLSWFTVVWECAAIVAPFCGTTFCLAWLAIGVVFHLMCAAIMGLNGFVWGFGATYAAIFWVAQLVERHLWSFADGA